MAPVTDLARLRGIDAGLHVYLELRPGLDAARVAECARRRGVGVTTLEGYHAGVPERMGLLLGYGNLEIPDIVRGAQILAGVIAEVAARSPR
ncbi:MAG TPA: hypothetical protein VMU89_08030 [Thermomicrobiaceae bacterium]|nr:hypothetical protein [Thermomicrobiaceae bacterium]